MTELIRAFARFLESRPDALRSSPRSWRELRRVRCVAASAAGGAGCRLWVHPATTACSRSCAAGLSATQCRRRFRHPAARHHPPRRARRGPAPFARRFNAPFRPRRRLFALPRRSGVGQQYALRDATRDGSIAPEADSLLRMPSGSGFRPLCGHQGDSDQIAAL